MKFLRRLWRAIFPPPVSEIEKHELTVLCRVLAECLSADDLERVIDLLYGYGKEDPDKWLRNWKAAGPRWAKNTEPFCVLDEDGQVRFPTINPLKLHRL